MRKEFNKLVRDKMIDIYKHDVENKISSSDFSIEYLDKTKTLALLKDKLNEEVEEALEVYDTDPEKLKEELADIIEVISGVLYHNNMTLEEVLAIREKKKHARGGFETGLYLKYIDYL